MPKRQQQVSATPTIGDPNHERDYGVFLQKARDRVAALLYNDDASKKRPVFVKLPLDKDRVFNSFLKALPERHRQHHNCNTCRSFFRHYGGLGTILDDGNFVPLLWDSVSAPAFYKASVQACIKAMKDAPVSPFYAADIRLGTPLTPPWQHLAVTLPPQYQYRHTLRSPHQEQALRVQAYTDLLAFLPVLTQPHLARAHELLKLQVLPRSEAYLEPLAWLEARLTDYHRLAGNRRNQLLLREVVTAPEAFLHIKGGMLGVLIQEVQANTPTPVLVKKWKTMTDPMQYQRPQALPGAGNVAAAENIIEKLGLKPSLQRKFASFEDIEPFLIWRAQYRHTTLKVGVFADTPTKQGRQAVPAQSSPVSAGKITLTRFLDVVVPNLVELRLRVPRYGAFVGVMTAAIPDSPPLLKWDREEARQQWSWFYFNPQSSAYDWCLDDGVWLPVPGLLKTPPEKTVGQIFFLLGPLMTLRQTKKGSCLFPEHMRPELREVRATIEAYSHTCVVASGGDANGYGMSLDPARGEYSPSIEIEAVTGTGTATRYIIDRAV